jgi:hypothetical protein
MFNLTNLDVVVHHFDVEVPAQKLESLSVQNAITGLERKSAGDTGQKQEPIPLRLLWFGESFWI